MRASSQMQRAGALVCPTQLSLTMWCAAGFSGAGVRRNPRYVRDWVRTGAGRRTVSQHGGGLERSLIRSSMRGRFRQSGQSPRRRPSRWCETKRACSGSAQLWRSSFRFGASPAARACSMMAAVASARRSLRAAGRSNCDWEELSAMAIGSSTQSRQPQMIARSQAQ